MGTGQNLGQLVSVPANQNALIVQRNTRPALAKAFVISNESWEQS